VKDNAGYDLRHLLIGAEGTLGLITAASLRLFPPPGETATAWVAVASPEAALALLGRLRGELGGAVSAFELMHVQGLEFLAEKLPQVTQPQGLKGEWRVLAEATDGAGAGVGARLEAALGKALEVGEVGDVLVAQNDGQRAAFWRIRESIPEANRLVGAVTNHDLSIPPSRLAEFVARVRPGLTAIDAGLRDNCFGHLGDGNLHFNTFPAPGRNRSEYDSLRPRITETVHDLAHGLGGSVAAEHGVGRLKAADLVRYGDPGKLAAMRAITAALDPLGILNPGAVLAGA
jgi:FAD/FMN-containing dehydrogenase